MDLINEILQTGDMSEKNYSLLFSIDFSKAFNKFGETPFSIDNSLFMATILGHDCTKLQQYLDILNTKGHIFFPRQNIALY